MRTVFTFLIFNLSLLIFNSNAQWVELDPGVDDALYDIYAITPDIAVAVGANGTIIKTTDGGETWQQKDSGTTETLLKVQFPTPEIGYVVGFNSIFLKSTNGGETWFSLSESSDCFFLDFSWVSEELIYNNCNGFLVKSTDGGYSWINIGPASAAYLQFKNSNVGYGLNGSSNLMKTENGGETWEEVNTIPIKPFHFLDENIGFGAYGSLFKTIDGGNTFTQIGGSEIEDANNIFAINENIIWGFLPRLLNGDGTTTGIIKVFKDNEGYYTEELWYDDDPTLDMASIHFADEYTGYIVGYKDWKTTIWKNATGKNTMSTNEPIAMHEIKIYPNPATTEITIEIQNSENCLIKLSDMTGKQVYSKEFHGNKMNLNVNQFVKGVYILTVFSKENTYSKKIIIN